MKTYCFDIDGTLCEQESKDYARALPLLERVAKVNALHDQGHRIILFTARGSQSGIDWTQVTRMQLESWGLRYHELITGKPHADVYVDDKAVNPEHFDWSSQ